jgi:ATP-dependent RNA helicase DDX52/ROK1
VVGPRVLILAPTRELAVQIHREATFLATGSTISVQLLECGEKKATTGDILLVSTPMHVAASLRSGKVCLSGVELLVLDEADRLFELGHGHEAPLPKELALMGGGGQMIGLLGLVDEVLAKCDHPKVQRALFSATMGDRVAELVASVLRDPVSVAVGLANAGASTIEQRLMFVGREQGKLVAIRQLVQEGLRPPVLVFMQSKERAKDLYHELMFDGINVDYITTDMSVEKRDATIRKFRLGKVG